MARPKYGGFVFTSNVDGQFQRAGFHSDRIVECHGSIHHLQAISGGSEIWPADALHIHVDEDTFLAKDPLPASQSGELARPNILMFGDYYWVSRRTNGQHDRFTSWIKMLRERNAKNVAVVDIGSGTAVPTARNMANRLSAMFENGELVRINPRDPDLGRSKGYNFSLGALETLLALEDKIANT